MIKLLLLTVFVLISGLSCLGQRIEGTEIGLDGSISGSTLGGAAGLGLKFGFKTSENFIFGPSFRMNKAWATTTSFSTAYSVTNWGGGFFAHGRYGNVLFGGVEAEVIQNNFFTVPNAIFKKIIPSVFICGGFSKEFNGFVRLNFGLYYDVINSLNSPYRNAYLISIKDPQTGQVVRRLPMIYRISFFFPLPNLKKEPPQENEEAE